MLEEMVKGVTEYWDNLNEGAKVVHSLVVLGTVPIVLGIYDNMKEKYFTEESTHDLVNEYIPPKESYNLGEKIKK